MIQIEWPGNPPVLIERRSAGVYWFSTPAWSATNRNERLISREDLEDFWPEEVLELADAAEEVKP